MARKAKTQNELLALSRLCKWMAVVGAVVAVISLLDYSEDSRSSTLRTFFVLWANVAVWLYASQFHAKRALAAPESLPESAEEYMNGLSILRPR